MSLDASQIDSEALAKICDNLPVGVYRTTPSVDIIYSNPSLANLFGYALDEFIRLNTKELYVNIDAREKLVSESQVNGAFIDYEVLFMKKDGAQFWGGISGKTVFDDDHHAQYFDGVIVDITEQKHAESSQAMRLFDLEQQRNTLDEILSSIPNTLMVFDRKRRHVYVNKPGLRLFSRSLDDVVGKTALEASVDENKARFIDTALEQVLATGAIVHGETDLLIAGEIREFQHNYSPIHDENGEVVAVLASLTDITERKEAESILVEQEKLSVALQKEREMEVLKGKMVTTIAHEFRTPLSIILSSGEILERYYDRISDEKRQDQINKIKEEVHRLAGMLEDMSIVAQTRFSHAEPKMSRFNLVQLLMTVVDTMQVSVGENHHLEFTAEDASYDVMADRQFMSRILNNLLQNSVNYAKSGTSIRINLSVEGSDTVVLQVADEGRGIPQLDQARIFEPFHRGSNIDQIRGTGFGLTIVKEYVDAHHGTIKVESEVNKGSTFTIRLPILTSHNNGKS
jgi:PAS domain S-box-containing protein